MSLDLQKLKDFHNSEEGKGFMKKYAEKIKLEHNHKERWTDKAVKLLESKTDFELGNLYTAYLKHAEKRSSILYERHIDGESSLNSVILEAFEKIGKVSKKKKDYGMFTAVVYLYRGFKAELLVGQGSFISISKL